MLHQGKLGMPSVPIVFIKYYYRLTTEGGIFEATLRLSDRAIERSSERSIDRASDRPIERSCERSSERPRERSSDRATERSSDRATGRSRDPPPVHPCVRPSVCISRSEIFKLLEHLDIKAVCFRRTHLCRSWCGYQNETS